MDRRERSGDNNAATLAMLHGFQSTIWTAGIGIIQSFNPATRTVTIQPAIRARVQDEAGEFTWVQLPILLDCPVYFPSGGGCTLTFPIKAGDECIYVISSRCIDGWYQSGGVQNQPDLRMHDLSDAIAFVGLNSTPKVIGSISTTKVQLRSDDGSAFIEIDPSSHDMQMKTTGKITLDAGSDILIKSATKITQQAPLLSWLGNITAVGTGGGAGTASFSNMTISYTGGSITMNGKRIDDTHTHGGVAPGGSNTNTPN